MMKGGSKDNNSRKLSHAPANEAKHVATPTVVGAPSQQLTQSVAATTASKDPNIAPSHVPVAPTHVEINNEHSILNVTPTVEDYDMQVSDSTPPIQEFKVFDEEISKTVSQSKFDGVVTKTIKKIKFHVNGTINDVVVKKLKKYKMKNLLMRSSNSVIRDQHYEVMVRENGTAQFKCALLVVNVKHISRKNLTYENLMSMPLYRDTIEKDFATVHQNRTLSFGATLSDPDSIIVICVKRVANPLVMYCEIMSVDESGMSKYPSAPYMPKNIATSGTVTAATSPYSSLLDQEAQRKRRAAAAAAAADGKITKKKKLTSPFFDKNKSTVMLAALFGPMTVFTSSNLYNKRKALKKLLQ